MFLDMYDKVLKAAPVKEIRPIQYRRYDQYIPGGHQPEVKDLDINVSKYHPPTLFIPGANLYFVH